MVKAGTLEDLVTLDRLLKDGYDRRATPTNHLSKGNLMTRLFPSIIIELQPYETSLSSSDNTTPTRVYLELFVRSFGSPNPLTMVSSTMQWLGYGYGWFSLARG